MTSSSGKMGSDSPPRNHRNTPAASAKTRRLAQSFAISGEAKYTLQMLQTDILTSIAPSEPTFRILLSPFFCLISEQQSKTEE
jgi:hypothetical protein